jgi:CheY-like chemotaxis protein
MQLKEASVLLAEDEPIILDIMREWFQRMVRQVFCAGDGAQALQVLAMHRIDLIITDVRMPVMDGITLLKRIKVGGSSAPRLIFITGFADIEARDAYDLGAEALLEKPIECEELIEVVRRSLLKPGKRWERQSDLSVAPVLNLNFRSLASALEEHRIAFGRGGFCVEKGEFLEEGPVNIELDFNADRFVLRGQGVIRWLANQEDQMGVELTYVAAKSRARAVKLTEGASSFIPRTTESKYQALAG